MARAIKKYEYVGDINPENGGMIVRLYNPLGYADVIRIEPCTDAGGPDNCYWISNVQVTLNMKPRDRYLVCEINGWNEATDGRCDDLQLVQFAVQAGKHDQMWSHMVRIGKADPFFKPRRDEGKWEPDVQLHAHHKIINYAMARAKEEFI